MQATGSGVARVGRAGWPGPSLGFLHRLGHLREHRVDGTALG
jgi:hypothetical protein